MNPRTGNMAMDEENENKEIERNEDVAETNSEVNDFVDNFLSSGDIQEIIESINPEDMNIDDILKNPRFNDGMAKILDKLPASEREMFVSQAKNKITQVATNVSGQKKKILPKTKVLPKGYPIRICRLTICWTAIKTKQNRKKARPGK